MEKQSNKKQKWIIMLIIFLLISVTLTTIVYFDCIRNYLPSDDGAIDILDTDTNGNNDGNQNNEGQGNKGDEFVAKPGFQGSDEQGVWKKNTNVEIFSISYTNDGTEVTVMSDDGDKVIAPGTDMSYTFKLKNTGNVAMDYDLDINAYINRDDVMIPVVSRLNRYDGKWIVGGTEEWVDIPTLDSTSDNMILGAGRFSWYTLDWKWPFESGDDDFDTYLGNLAMDSDITFTIEIKTVATVNENPSYIGGIVPSTGDETNTWLYASLAGGSMLILLVLLYKKEKKEDDSDE